MVSTYQRHTKLFALTSLMIHAVLILGAGIFFTTSTPSLVMGDGQVTMVRSYLYKSVASEAETHSVAKKVIAQKERVSRPATKAQSAAESSSKGQKVDELLSMLHTAIQEQQHYPASAMQMERQGRVTVQFTLLINGAISDLSIIKSSGTDSLDQAAIAAVHDAVPFAKVDQFIQTARSFSIDVVFELA